MKNWYFIKNPACLFNFPIIDYILFDKTSTLTAGEFKAEAIYFGNKFYKFDPEELSKKLNSKNK